MGWAGRVGLAGKGWVGTHQSWLGGRGRSWPGGRGGRGGGYPPELAWWTGGVDQGPWLQERVGGGVGTMAVPKKGEGWGLVGCSKEEQVQGRGQGRVGLAVGQGARASVAGGVVFVVSGFF